MRVSSRRGAVVLPAAASAQVLPTQAFIAMHWGDECLGGHNGSGAAASGVNALTTGVYCPQSHQPELKHSAVKIERAELPWRLLGLAWLEPGQDLDARAALQALMVHFAFAVCVPFGRERPGVLFRAADAVAPPSELLETIERHLGLTGPQVLRYKDERRGQRRSVRLAGQGDAARLVGMLLGGDTAAEAWMKPILQEELPAHRYGRLFLLPGSTPPVPVAVRGKQVCSCFDVSTSQIEAALAHAPGSQDERLVALQSELKCGTNCGSCIPELKRMVRQATLAA